MARQTLATLKARAARVDTYALNEAARWLDEQFGESILVDEAQPWELVLWMDRYYPGGWAAFLRGI